MIELLHSYDKTSTDEELFLTGELRKWFLEMECIPSKDAEKGIEMTTKDFVYYKNLPDEAAAGFEKTDSNFGRSSTVSKMLYITCYREITHEMRQTLLLSYFKKLPDFSTYHLDQPAATNTEAIVFTSKKLWFTEGLEDD